MTSPFARRDGEPWFYRRPALSIGVTVALYLAIFILRMTSGTAAEATMLFFVLPISLLAVTFGMAWGLAGGLIAIALMVVWAVAEHIELTPLGWVTRALPMVLLGILVGRAADRLRISEAERAQLNAAAHWHRQAVEINDAIVQGLTAAKWSLEAGKLDRALETVTGTLDSAQAMVSQLLRDAELAPGAAHEKGSLSALQSLAHRAKSTAAGRARLGRSGQRSRVDRPARR